MTIYKYTFKDLTVEDRQKLITFLVESKIPHELEIYDTTKEKLKQAQRLFKQKHNIT